MGGLGELVAMGVVVAGGMAGVVSPAQAQETFPAVVTEVVDGDTVDTQFSDGRALRVRLIGIDTPSEASAQPIKQPPTWRRSPSGAT